MKFTEQQLRVMRSPQLTLVLARVIEGQTYSLKIAEWLGKDFSTVSRQLKDLQKAGLVVAGERDKAQHFLPNWSVLLKAFEEYVWEHRFVGLDKGDKRLFIQLRRTREQEYRVLWKTREVQEFFKAYLLLHLGTKSFSYGLGRRDLKKELSKDVLDFFASRNLETVFEFFLVQLPVFGDLTKYKGTALYSKIRKLVELIRETRQPLESLGYDAVFRMAQDNLKA